GKTSSASDLFRRGVRVIARYVREEPRRFALAVTGASLYAAAAVGSTVVLGRVTQNVVLPAFSGGVTKGTVVAGSLAILAMGLLRAVSIVLRRYNGGLTAFRVQAHWRRRISDAYLDVPLEFHRSRPTGELLAHTDSDVLAATEVMSPVPFTIGVFALIFFALISLALVDIWLMLLALLLFPALALLNRVYTKRVERPAEQVQEEVGAVSRIVHESIDGALVVKTLGRSDQEIDRLQAAAERLRTTRIYVGRLRGSFEPVLQGLPAVGSIALLALGSYEISLGRITTGDLVQGIALFSILAFPLQVVGYFLEELPRAVVSSARLDAVMATPRAPVPDPVDAEALPDAPLDIELDAVSFSYEPDQEVLDSVSMRVSPGEVVALVGSTGSGKTTLCELLVRLADPDSGTVRVGGVDLRHAEPDSLHAGVALVFQETFLFADTLWENVALGQDVGNDEVRRALRVARAERFVSELPMGVATVVGERGVTLSGGQRQRVALARALLRRPRVLILDDATSAVDPVVESEILGGLRRELATTTLVVAQRVSTIELADRVVFLDDGTVRAEGTHDELLATVPAYERIVRAYETADES
ncbi:MAG: ABC transporter ATP-binding protein, partial [Acidimicrobiales bacterium]